MTKEEYIAKHRDELAGIACDGITSNHREGAMLAMWIKKRMEKIDAKCAVMFDDSTTKDLDALADLLIGAWNKASLEKQRCVKEKLRAAFNPPEKKP